MTESNKQGPAPEEAGKPDAPDEKTGAPAKSSAVPPAPPEAPPAPAAPPAAEPPEPPEASAQPPAVPPAPPPGAPPVSGDGSGDAEQRQMAMFAHLSALLGGLLSSGVGGWGCFIGPLII